MDVTGDLMEDVFHWYQELIGTLRWEVYISRIDILLEV